ncbi:MAG: hypothetical protein CL816_04040 [Coxiellaceae bacterium]|nr:hypothetical protein [Coxiellaceae bacterium]
MTPVIIENKQGIPWLATDSRCESQVITVVPQQLINTLDYHNPLALAIEKPRIHAQLLPDVILYESSISPGSMIPPQKTRP